MKKSSTTILSLFGIVLLLSLVQCSGNKAAETINSESSGNAATDENNSLAASCIWDNTAVRDTPSDKGKYITAISIGELVTHIQEEVDSTDKFVKIRLNDGTEGWTKKDFIVLDSKPYVFMNDADVYSRPDALTKTDKRFSKYDIVAITNAKDDFFEVKGKRSTGKWIESGWIKKTNLSQEKLDIASAKFIKKALNEPDDAKKVAALQGILNNGDLSSSIFYDELQDMINTLNGTNEAAAEEQYDEGGD